MIEFGCKSCGRFFRVSEDKAGKKSKCPDCGNVLQVPLADDDELDFDENFELDHILAELIEITSNFIAQGAADLIFCKPMSDTTLSIVVRCEGDRTQAVLVHTAYEDNEQTLIISSYIGNYSAIREKPDAFFNLVVDCAGFPIASTGADKDGGITLRHIVADPSIVENYTILSIIIHLGKYADTLEQKYFMVDVH